MAEFCTRIELHGANAEDYQRLHEAMARSGFSRELNSRHLPTAEYWLNSTLNVDQVREKAKAVAATVKPSYEILVVQVATWSGYLTPVRKAG